MQKGTQAQGLAAYGFVIAGRYQHVAFRLGIADNVVHIGDDIIEVGIYGVLFRLEFIIVIVHETLVENSRCLVSGIARVQSAQLVYVAIRQVGTVKRGRTKLDVHARKSIFKARLRAKLFIGGYGGLGFYV